MYCCLGPTLATTTSTASTSNAAALKARRDLGRVRTRVYDSFLRRSGAASLDELVLSAEDDQASQEPSPWCWAVNYDDLGAPVEVKRKELHARFPQAQDLVWVPLLGAPYSLLRFSSPEEARQAVFDQRELNELKGCSAEHRPLFLELARPSAVASRLHPVPGRYDIEGAIEFAPGKVRWPSGAEVWFDFITEEDERRLMAEMRRAGGWPEAATKRLSVHFGPHFDYTRNATNETVNSIPDWAQSLLAALPYQDGVLPVDQMSGQLYPPGSGIPPHVDAHSPFDGVIWGVSFGSTVTMDFKECGDTEEQRMREAKRSLRPDPDAPTLPMSLNPPRPVERCRLRFSIDLPPRALLVLRGPARYAYTHGIRSRKVDPVGKYGEELRPRGERYSLTFRSCRKEAVRRCDCEWGRWCDSRFDPSEAVKATTGPLDRM